MAAVDLIHRFLKGEAPLLGRLGKKIGGVGTTRFEAQEHHADFGRIRCALRAGLPKLV